MLFSVHVVPVIVPVQADWMVCRAKGVTASYRLTMYPATALPFDKVLADQLTVTAPAARLAVGVAPWLIVVAAEAPLPPGPELALQYAQATPVVRAKTKKAAAQFFGLHRRARVTHAR